MLVPMLVFLTVVAVRYDGRHFIRGDGLFYLVTARSLELDGDLDLANQLAPPLEQWSGHVALDRHGRLVPKHPVAFALASLPFIAAFGPPGALVLNLLLLAAGLLLAFRLAARLVTPWPAAAAVVLTGIGSFLPHYAWNYSADVFASVLLLAAVAVLVPGSRELAAAGGGAPRPEADPDPPGEPAERRSFRARRLAATAGLLLGLAVAAKYAIVVAGAWVPLLVRRARHTGLAFALGLAIPLTGVAALNIHLFGAAWTTGYDRMVDLHEPAPRLATDRDRLARPRIAELGKLLAVPRHGLATTSPITLLSLAALPLLWSRDRRLAVVIAGAALTLGLLLVVYLAGRVDLSSHYGNRYLMPLVLLGVAPLAVLLERLRQGWRAGSGRRTAAARD